MQHLVSSRCFTQEITSTFLILPVLSCRQYNNKLVLLPNKQHLLLHNIEHVLTEDRVISFLAHTGP